jgi:glutamate-ammonia-ligase adenylyltransferase
MRQRLEPKPERGRPFPLDLKRGPGGIVDVEFIAQILVLKVGYEHPSLRLTGTRQALLQLLQGGHLDEGEGRFLLEAYDRLREIEKGMRRASEQADNLLPAGRDLAVLARALGQDEPQGLVREIEQLMRETRRVFLRVFAVLAQEQG